MGDEAQSNDDPDAKMEQVTYAAHQPPQPTQMTYAAPQPPRTTQMTDAAHRWCDIADEMGNSENWKSDPFVKLEEWKMGFPESSLNSVTKCCNSFQCFEEAGESEFEPIRIDPLNCDGFGGSF